MRLYASKLQNPNSRRRVTVAFRGPLGLRFASGWILDGRTGERNASRAGGWVVLSLAAVHLSSSALLAVAILGGVVWLVVAILVASYGQMRGYGWLPLFVCCLVPGFWPVVLLTVTVAPRRYKPIERAGHG